jgi:hypothetical protein
MRQRNHVLDCRRFARIERPPEAHWISAAPAIIAVTLANFIATLFALKMSTHKPWKPALTHAAERSHA